MHASELSAADVGKDITIIVSGIATGGVLHNVCAVMGMIDLDIDGTKFLVDEESSVELNEPTLEQELTTPVEFRRPGHISKQYAVAH